MSEHFNDIRTRCRLNILRLYPAHRQAQLTDRTDFEAWKAENVAHMQKLIDSGTEEIDEDWPDPAKWKRREPSAAEAMLKELKDKIDERPPAHEEPPAEIAEDYEAYGMDPDALLKKHAELSSWIADAGRSLPPASDEQKALHARLNPHVPWLKQRSKAVDVL